MSARWPGAILLSPWVAWLFHEVASLATLLTDGGTGLPFRSGDFGLIGVGFGGRTVHDPELVALNVALTAPVFAVAIRLGVKVAIVAFSAALLAVPVGLWGGIGALPAGRVGAWLLAVGSAGAIVLCALASRARRVERRRS